MAGRAVGEEHELVPAFGERHEEREENRADEQPVADETSIATAPADGTEHEPDGQRQHVDDDDVLERPRIKGLERRRRRRRRGRTAC